MEDKIDDEVTDEELSDIFSADISDDVDDEENIDEMSTDESESDVDIAVSDEDIPDTGPEIDQNEFLSELVDEGEDVVIENVNELLNDYKFTEVNGQFRYIFDEILSKYWYNHVYNAEGEQPDMNMYYRWLAVVNFNSLLQDESWETFILTEGNGEKIIKLYNDDDLPKTNDVLDDIYDDSGENDEEVISDDKLDSLIND